jgi:hypothetical protein
MPRSLIDFLFLGSKLVQPIKLTQNINKNKQINLNEYKYNITDDEIIKLLMKLDDSYNHQTNKWLIITSILKSLNKFQIWDDWSTLSTKYNKENNLTIWNNNEGLIDINYLIYILNKNEPIKKIDNIQKI